MMPDFTVEAQYRGPVAGVDEAGRGPLAGPVVAAAVVLDPDAIPDGLDDSKKLSATRRAVLDIAIRHSAIGVGVGMASVEEIDRLNILWATMLAMRRAVEALRCDITHVLVDGNRCPDWRWRSTAVVGGDARCLSIAAASIIAKETRDRIMIEAAQAHPHYGWDRNKGYGSALHMAALRDHGPTALHRRSFAPVARMLLA